MLDATNAEDSDAFLASFADDAVVDDWGRQFAGREQIAGWNDRENIGTHNRIAVTGSRVLDDAEELDVQVTGDGYNGGGTFTIQTRDGVITRMVIRG